MLYYLFEYLEKNFELAGAGLFQFSSFRAALAIIFSLVISLILGEKWIALLRKQQVKETVRELGLAGESSKQGTPTMGGVIILTAIVLPTVLFAKLDNIYIILMLLTTIWMGAVGFLDDYIKVFKGNKAGLAGRFKIIGQVGLGLIVGLTMFFHSDIKVRQDISNDLTKTHYNEVNRYQFDDNGVEKTMMEYRAPVTHVPFFKQWEFDYGSILSFLGDGYHKWAFLIYIPMVIFIITSVSNGANMTDGLDGLATGVSGIVGATLCIFAFVSGNIIAANYLNILHLPQIGELLIFAAAFVGACVGFLWFNAYPAQVFMGDTGSLAIGGIIGTMTLALRIELLVPILCGVFLAENLSVMMQVSYFKYTKRKYGAGKRIFLMSPLHHHYQKKGISEPKIVTRFWIATILLAVLTFVTLKMR